jgi:putative tryptophan/tyrosine transport system substrate-binding protein
LPGAWRHDVVWPVLTAWLRKLAPYVSAIIKGAKPASLPVEQPNYFELIVNQKAATATGITIPQALLLRADEVIE